MYVCNMTTPAQYFHVLRRQLLHPARKPLIIMSPKSLLRHPEAVSTIDEFVEHGFQPIVSDGREGVDAKKVRRVLLCSGKVYYDLKSYAAEHGVDDVAILRVEQLYPLDQELLKSKVSKYPKDAEIVWVQEEPKNMGSWHYIFPLLIEAFGASPLPRYVGRMASASPATGAYESHELEQNRLVKEAFEK